MVLLMWLWKLLPIKFLNEFSFMDSVTENCLEF